jgi:hypothetical protein
MPAVIVQGLLSMSDTPAGAIREDGMISAPAGQGRAGFGAS